MDIKKRIVLSAAEEKEYQEKIVNVIPQCKGKKYYKDFYKSGEVTSTRIGRRFYEDVVDGKFPNVTLVGKRARDGYNIA